ncbi:MAG: hypothetical protein II169_09020 [Lachnospiraceae bacterium]|nr:hypothetical protein [Lachnospiraceae bacterium]
MGNRKVLLIVVIAVVVLAVGAVVATFLGVDLFATVSGEAGKQPDAFSSVDDLKSGKAYVWHHDGGDIKEDLKKDAGENVYFTCITGDYNFKNEELGEAIEYPRSIWVDSATDDRIPTVTSKDRLIYVSSTEVPQEIVFERFADYGYSIGISNMEADKGGHYFMTFADVDDDDYKYFIDMNSDASQLTELTAITRLYLDKVGDVKVNEDSVSDGGTVLGLKKDKKYTCEFYTGTYYQDFNLTANIHCFGSMERFVNYDCTVIKSLQSTGQVNEAFTEISRPMMVVVGIVLMIFWSPLFVELRRLTKSVWPCVILHSMEDAVPTMLFVTANVLQIKETYSVMLDPISGILPTLLVFFTGLGLRKCRMNRETDVGEK